MSTVNPILTIAGEGSGSGPEPFRRASPETLARQRGIIAGQELFVSFMDLVPLPVLILNDCRQTVYINTAAQTLIGALGRSPAEVVGMRPGEIMNCTHAADTPAGCGTGESCRHCGAFLALFNAIYLDSPDERECRILRANSGEALDLRVWTHPHTVAGEKFTFTTLADISTEKRRAVLEKIFFHDILNTAGAIKGSAELLHGNHDLDTETKKDLQNILHRGTANLVKDLQIQRNLLAAENNELTVTSDSIDSLALLNEVADLYSHHELAHNRHISIAGNSDRVVLHNDETMLSRVIGNMVKNALEATPEAGEVILACHLSEDSMIKFSVHNPGLIPREVQLQIFQRSYSTKGPGRGIGTYSMKLLSERYMGGKVGFVSTESGGTVFSASFPLNFFQSR